MVALQSFVRSHVCCERALQCTATSANLHLAFAIERFLSRSCSGVGAAGKGIPIRMASLRSGCSRGWEVLTIKRGKGEGIVISGKARCRPMGRAAEGRIERAEWDDEEASKEREGFSKQNNQNDCAGMSGDITNLRVLGTRSV